MPSRFSLVLWSLCFGIASTASAQDASELVTDQPAAAEEVAEPARSDEALPDLRRELLALRDQHGDLVRGVVEHGLLALERAESRQTARDQAGMERAMEIARAARRVATKRVAVRAAQGRLRLLRSRIEALRARGGSS